MTCPLYRVLMAETVDSAALTLQGVDNIEGRDGLALGVLAVERGVLDDLLQESAEGSTRFVIDEAGEALHTSAARHAADGRLGDTLNVLCDDLGMTLGAGFTFASTITYISVTYH